MMPMYLVAELCRHLPALEAGELLNAVTAASVPHTTRYARDTLYFQLNTLIHANTPAPLPPGPKEKDPEQAAAWYAAQGIKVVKAS